MIEIFINILAFILMVYIINVPVYALIKRKIMDKQRSESMRMLKPFREHVEKYKLNVGFVENAIPESYESNTKLLKALHLTDDLHYYLKMHSFYLSDEKCNLIFGDCIVVTKNDTGDAAQLYKIELRPVKN